MGSRGKFGRLTSKSELGPVEFEMALDIEEQARISEQMKHNRVMSSPEECKEIEGIGDSEHISIWADNTDLLSSENRCLSSLPDFKFPLEVFQTATEGTGDTDPMKKPPSQLQSQFLNKNSYLYTHHRFISEAESYTAHWESSILHDKDKNSRVSTSGFFQQHDKYKSPYLGPVGWTVPSKYYSATRRKKRKIMDDVNTSRASNGYFDVGTTNGSSCATSGKARSRSIQSEYHSHASHPFLIYQDPEWVEPPRGTINAYFDRTASDDKENDVPGSQNTEDDSDIPHGGTFLEAGGYMDEDDVGEGLDDIDLFSSSDRVENRDANIDSINEMLTAHPRQ